MADRWWHSKPVARSLDRLEAEGLLVRVTGRTDGHSFFGPPFCAVVLTPEEGNTGARWGTGEPIYNPGTTFVCKPRELHALMDRLCGGYKED